MIRLFAIALLVSVAPFATAGGQEYPTGPEKLLLWQGFKFEEVTLLRENVAEFTKAWNASHPWPIEIEIAQVPFNEMVRKLKSAALARRTPDMAFVDANAMVSLAFGNMAVELDKLPNFPGGGIENFREAYVSGAFDTNVITFRGEQHLYGIPAQTTTLALFWNRKRFADKGPELRAAGLDPTRAPRDWDEFIQYGKILTEPAKGLYGFGMNNSLWFTMPFFNQYGTTPVRRRADGMLEAAFATKSGEAALSRKANFYLRDGIEAGAWREGSMDPDQGFANEKYAMVLTGPWMIDQFRGGGLDFGVAMIPRVPLEEAKQLGIVPQDATEESTSTEQLSAGNIGGQNLVVVRKTRYADIAFQFALYFTSEPVQRLWAERLGQIPVLKSAQQGLDLSSFPEVPTFIRQINLAKPLPPLPFGAALETEIANPEMNLVLQGKQSVSQALKNIDGVITRRILTPVNHAELSARER